MTSDMHHNIGFEGRKFLHEYEWNTYRRRKPVRYINKERSNTCQICGKPPLEGNPLQNAHLIGFGFGIIKLGLTPDFLDSHKNIVTAHRKVCNNSAELSLLDTLKMLKSEGAQKLPSYLSEEIQKLWCTIQ